MAMMMVTVERRTSEPQASPCSSAPVEPVHESPIPAGMQKDFRPCAQLTGSLTTNLVHHTSQGFARGEERYRRYPLSKALHIHTSTYTRTSTHTHTASSRMQSKKKKRCSTVQLIQLGDLRYPRSLRQPKRLRAQDSVSASSSTWVPELCRLGHGSPLSSSPGSGSYPTTLLDLARSQTTSSHLTHRRAVLVSFPRDVIIKQIKSGHMVSKYAVRMYSTEKELSRQVALGSSGCC
ncbi:hypothetical protein F4808DRAFT_52443 [Astrocystis sublimbata]|nr:hypothetical protein F4808DRAFT_52443 [Astrocystis sublimbata]